MDLVGAGINEVRGAIASLTTNSKGDAALQKIKPLSEWGLERFRIWVSDMERYYLFVGTPEDRKSELALVTTAGQVGEFITGILNNDRRISWRDLKSRLNRHYNDTKRPVELLTELAKITQNRGEKMRSYIQRVINTAEGAFNPDWQGHEIVRGIVKDFFIEGLYDDGVKIAGLRGSPGTTEEAYELAVAESKLRDSIRNSRERREKPMGKRRYHRPSNGRSWDYNR